ncbi:TerB family tellurite resistance protein [bacterium]|nr:TerB family tellurite resistance protein [bacterium]
MNSTTPHDSLLAICLHAAFSDGEQSDAERREITRYAAEMNSDHVAQLSRQILMGKLSIEKACAGLGSKQDRMLAYEMAHAICQADGSISAEEQEFLTDLRRRLTLAKDESGAHSEVVDSVVLAPLASTPQEATATDNDRMILRYAILVGALELLPQNLATAVIIPMQMKMVYRIGKAHGVELDRTNIKDFLATAGIGLGSQMVEGFARKLMGRFGRKLGGETMASAADQLAGSALSFASTYAIGHVAQSYYAGGSNLTAMDLRKLIGPLQDKARELHTQYLPEIEQRAKTLDSAAILSLIRGTTPI